MSKKLNRKQSFAIERATGLKDVTDSHSIYACFSDQYKATGAGTWAHRSKGHAYINMYDAHHIDTWNIPINQIIKIGIILTDPYYKEDNE